MEHGVRVCGANNTATNRSISEFLEGWSRMRSVQRVGHVFLIGVGGPAVILNVIALVWLYKLHIAKRIKWKHIYFALGSLAVDVIGSAMLVATGISTILVTPTSLLRDEREVLYYSADMAATYCPLSSYLVRGILQLWAIKWPFRYVRIFTKRISKMVAVGLIAFQLISVGLTGTVSSRFQQVENLTIVDHLVNYSLAYPVFMFTLLLGTISMVTIQACISRVLRQRQADGSLPSLRGQSHYVLLLRLQIYIQVVFATVFLAVSAYMVILGFILYPVLSSGACNEGVMVKLQEFVDMTPAVSVIQALWCFRLLLDPLVYFVNVNTKKTRRWVSRIARRVVGLPWTQTTSGTSTGSFRSTEV